jgi:hypothetical protein
MQFSPPSFHLIPLRSKYPPQTTYTNNIWQPYVTFAYTVIEITDNNKYKRETRMNTPYILQILTAVQHYTKL